MFVSCSAACPRLPPYEANPLQASTCHSPRETQEKDRRPNRKCEWERRQSHPRSHYGGKSKGPDPKEWWRTLWRRLLRTNKDSFSFTGRMHLHSLEAKASEPGSWKEAPAIARTSMQTRGSWRQKGERSGSRRRAGWRGKKQDELSLELQKTNKIKDICTSHTRCPTDFDAESMQRGRWTSRYSNRHRKTFPSTDSEPSKLFERQHFHVVREKPNSFCVWWKNRSFKKIGLMTRDLIFSSYRSHYAMIWPFHQCGWRTTMLRG